MFNNYLHNYSYVWLELNYRTLSYNNQTLTPKILGEMNNNNISHLCVEFAFTLALKWTAICPILSSGLSILLGFI